MERLDTDAQYYLIVAGAPDALVGVAIVDARTGEIQSSATLSNATGQWLLDERDVIATAGLTTPVRLRLVWAPSQASRSPLYPLWEVSNKDGRVFVDVSGRRWDALTSAGPG